MRVVQLLAAKRLDLEIDSDVQELIAERGYDPHYGARPLKRVIQRLIQDPLAVQILAGEFPEGSKIAVRVRDRSATGGDTLEFAKV